MLETPAGEMIPNSDVLMDFAHEVGAEAGLELFPKDALVAARMRLQMVKYNKFFNSIFAVYLSRGKDQLKMDNLAAILPELNEFLAPILNGTWLSGSNQPTMVDIYCEPWLEFIVGWSMTPMKYITDELDLATKAPNVFTFVEKFRSH